jgi:hypothetical protein
MAGTPPPNFLPFVSAGVWPDIEGYYAGGVAYPPQGTLVTFTNLFRATDPTQGPIDMGLQGLVYLKNTLIGTGQPGTDPKTRPCKGSPTWGASTWEAILAAVPSFTYWVNLTAGGIILFPIDAPLGAILTGAQIGLYGAQGHSAFPGGAPQHMPTLDVWEIDLNASATSILSAIVTDAASTVATYETKHTLTASIPNVTVDALHTYWIAFTPESGTNSIASSSTGTWSYGAKATFK